jgi:hypothetical protein
VIAGRIEALVLARVHASAKPLPQREIVNALVRYAPPTLTEGTWRDQLERTVEDLRTREILDDKLQLRDKDQLATAIGRHSARSWRQLADRILPALGLGVAPGDTKALAKLSGRDEWTAAIMARALGLWTDGPPPSLAAACDAYAWRELDLPGKPKRCPPEIRAVFVQRALQSEAGPPELQVRLYAAKTVGAPRAELRVIRDALVRAWCAGKPLGGPPDAPARPFAALVRAVASAAHDGVFGDRKVFIAAVWNELRRSPAWSSLTLDDFKSRLVAAHRAGDLELARADLVAAMDPELVAASETTTDGASFHFIVREASS